MSFRIEPAEALASDIRRIALEQIERARDELSGGTADRHEAVHDARKRFKKLRALVRLVRASNETFYACENARFRDIARALSAMRDKTAMIEAIDALEADVGDAEKAEAFAEVRPALLARRDGAGGAEEGLNAAIEATLAQLGAARLAFESFTLGGKPRPKAEARVVAAGYGATHARARTALKIAARSCDAEDLHELRKHVKYHAAHLGLLAAVWPEALRPLRETAERIGDELGRDHDFAVLRATLAAKPAAFGSQTAVEEVVALAELRQTVLRASALSLSRRLFAEKPDAAHSRIERLYRLAAEGRAF